MKYALALALLITSQSSMASPSFGFGNMLKAAQCARSADCNMSDFEPEAEPDPKPLTSENLTWDLAARDRHYLRDMLPDLTTPDCPDPSSNYTQIFMDVDRDGDTDILMGFQCFSMAGPNPQPGVNQAGKDNPALKFDPYWGWIADSYLAVLINRDGEFVLDQTIFGGEFPVYDQLLKSIPTGLAVEPNDVNGDGYPDVILKSHWDNSFHMIVNQLWWPEDRWNESQNNGDDAMFSSGGAVLLSDGQGGYQVKILSSLPGGSLPSFLTDENGDVYLYNTNSDMLFTDIALQKHQSSLSPELLAPEVFKISGSQFIDVTDDYLVKVDSPNHDGSVSGAHCYIHLSKYDSDSYRTTNNWGEPRSPCRLADNNLGIYHKSQNYNGKIYSDGYNTSSTLISTDLTDFNRHCYDYSFSNQDVSNCVSNTALEKPIKFDSIRVYAMDSKRGLYLADRVEHEFTVREFVLPTPEAPKIWIYYIKIDGNWIMEPVAQSSGHLYDTHVVNYSGIQLDPGIEPEDTDELVWYMINRWLVPHGIYNFPQIPLYSQMGNALVTQFVPWPERVGMGMYNILKDGYCPEILVIVEPEDCVTDPAYYTARWTRDGLYQGAPSLSIGFKEVEGELEPWPELTGLPMPVETTQQLLDYDSDGDADLYVWGAALKTSLLAMFENTPEGFVLQTGNIWDQAVRETKRHQRWVCQPQTPEQGQWDNTLCDINPNDTKYGTTEAVDSFEMSDEMIFISQYGSWPFWRDMNGDGFKDIVAFKTPSATEPSYLEIIYAE